MSELRARCTDLGAVRRTLTEWSATLGGAAVSEALLAGLGDSAAAICLADDADLIRYANPTYRTAFFPQFDGCPADFSRTIVAAIKSGIGIKLDTADPDDVMRAVRRADDTRPAPSVSRRTRLMADGHGYEVVQRLDAGCRTGHLVAETGGVQAS